MVGYIDDKLLNRVLEVIKDDTGFKIWRRGEELIRVARSNRPAVWWLPMNRDLREEFRAWAEEFKVSDPVLYDRMYENSIRYYIEGKEINENE